MHFNEPKKSISIGMMGRSSDFKFWEEELQIHHHSCDDEADFEVDRVGVNSPPLWTRAAVDFRQETSTLLPQNHQYSCASPTSRLRAIIDGRRELTEMIKNMPESSYELSLKDIVDDQQNVDDAQEKKVVLAEEEKKVKHKRESRIPQKSKNRKSKQICRTESMESEVFLLKMFLPASLISSKKKANATKLSKQSSEGSEKPAKKYWWKVISLVKDSQYNMNINKRTSDISCNQTREKNCKSRAQRGCLF